MLFLFEIIGTIAFAISGAMSGIQHKMDLFGVTMMGLTTAVGGGMIRDVMIGKTPPTAFEQPVYALCALVISLIVFMPSIRHYMHMESPAFIIMDSIGLGTFTVCGVIANPVSENIIFSVFLGTLTGVGGGILRDIFSGSRPYVFVKHFYACAAIIGGIVCAVFVPFNKSAAMLAGAIVVITLRIAAARYRWSLPRC